MELFFKLASPTTLASMFADIEQADTTDTAANELQSLCLAELVAIVGDLEAIALIEAAGGK